jgi:ribosome biogenesis GTPase
MNLIEFGWNDKWAAAFDQLTGSGQLTGREKSADSSRLDGKGQAPARVVMEQKGLYKLVTEGGEVYGEVSGKFRYGAEGYDSYPTVGDWVVIDAVQAGSRAVIQAVLPRRSKFSRKVAGALTQEQVVAANFDFVLIVNSLNFDFNLRKIERYLTMAWESGAMPVIVLSKKDLCPDADSRVREVEAVAPGVPVIATSAVTGEGVEEIREFLGAGKTVAVLGSSGVGKSTLTNLLAGEEVMETREIREDDSRGRHTTTFRNLVKLSWGGMIIDTPGMRELQLWESDSGLQGAFEDVESLGLQCRFKDCSHENEPGCAVSEAIRNGSMPAARLESYKKLKKELRFIESKHNQSLRLAERKNEKNLSKAIKRYNSVY